MNAISIHPGRISDIQYACTALASRALCMCDVIGEAHRSHVYVVCRQQGSVAVKVSPCTYLAYIEKCGVKAAGAPPARMRELILHAAVEETRQTEFDLQVLSSMRESFYLLDVSLHQVHLSYFL